MATMGEQVAFRKSALSGVEFRALCSGQRVRYQIRDTWLGKEAVEVHPLSTVRIAKISRSRRLWQNVEVRLNSRGGKRRCGNAWFRYATEREARLWLHPRGRRSGSLFRSLLTGRSRHPWAFDGEGGGISGTLWTRAAASWERQGRAESSRQIRRCVLTLSPCADPICPVGRACARRPQCRLAERKL